MKKALIIVLAVVFVLAFASVALAAQPAAWTGYSAYRDPVMGASGDTPHGNYTAGNDECEICHSPHNAGNGTISYKLLRATAQANACDYCHLGGSAKATGYVVYTVSGTANLQPANGHQIADFDALPDSTVNNIGASLECFDCHTVHGAGAIASVTSVNGKTLNANGGAILKSNPNGTGVVTTVTGFCANCHNKNYVTTKNGASHVMKAAGGNGDASSEECVYCHKDGSDPDYLWPHNSQGEALIEVQNPDSSWITRGSMDTLCISCHQNVGDTF